ncbi:shikimate dehydrogenase [Actinacidiphila yanglinensis]|uniref:Shikimate dehydrogenase (NADP(+)) n=1 Tax=Actinacidiphila yanglinensis TaxID=310779 RepID=A0A1H6DB66_9ACTN|nr:shikimate dehydrogenase [Actinacidiphila yanglinensis]SEG82677.1 shikimate dehydrogenase [Actinacidiphila yanglinensis]
MADRSTYLIGLIGSGIGTSLSPELHHREADRHHIRLVYRILDIDGHGAPADALADLLHAARDSGFDGLNITHPCKQLVIPHLDELSNDAAALGAVNTVVFADGRTFGHNTDVTGFGSSFVRALPDAPLGHVVQLGAGGAGAAVAHAMLRMGTRHLCIVDTDARRAADLAKSLSAHTGTSRVTSADAAELPRLMAGADGLVHATPTGMVGHPGMPVPATLLREELWVADIVYRPMETELLRAARAAGARTVGGGGMVALQAADAFALFTGLEPHRELMLDDVALLTSAGR